MPLDFDVERLTPPMSSLKAHGKPKRSLSDPTISMPVRFPPWYIRLFLYGMMIICFCGVLFWTPGSGQPKNFVATYHADRAAVYKGTALELTTHISEF